MLTFLTRKYLKGASYGTLNSDRSAISIIAQSRFTDDEDLSRFFKAVYKLRPPKAKYTEIWDTSIVLGHLRQLVIGRDGPLKLLSKKLAVLLALASAQRVQTLAAIEIRNIRFDTSGVRITIDRILKTSAINRPQPNMFFPFFEADPSLCVAKCIQDYLFATELIRNDTQELFISYTKPHNKIGPQTISRWIKEVLSDCGIDVTIFSGHSTRHASTSKAESQGVSLDLIFNSAGWTAGSKTFANFYKRPIKHASSNNFYDALLADSCMTPDK